MAVDSGIWGGVGGGDKKRGRPLAARKQAGGAGGRALDLRDRAPPTSPLHSAQRSHPRQPLLRTARRSFAISWKLPASRP